MQLWTELRTALMLARHGTVSAAAEALGVHRATVNRHIDALEAEFQAKLFQRHARGYTLTEGGQEMLEIASRADEMFTDLAGRNRGRSATLSGNLIITSLSAIAPLIMPALRDFHRDHPQIKLEFAASADLARLEHGEAHIAFRAGLKPATLDYIVTHFCDIRFGLYASRRYVDMRGQPRLDDLVRHSFVGTGEHPSRLPFTGWILDNVGADHIAFNTADQQVAYTAIKEGVGLGFIAEHEAQGDPDLVEIAPPRQDWSSPIWIVTHVDLHRTQKVQQFLGYIKRAGPRPVSH